jgi:hypothetical protein
VLHGLVHLWYVTLSQGWVEYQAEMGWTGNSWVLSKWIEENTSNLIAASVYSLATIFFLVAGIGLIANQEWFRPWMLGASIISLLAIFVFWDGSFSLLVQKGLLGFLISLSALTVFNLIGWQNL